MDYITITTTNFITDETQDHIIITRLDGSIESFPVDPENPRYQQFLLDLEQEG